MGCSMNDPLGFLNPFTLTANILLQELCRVNLGWDEQGPVYIREQSLKWAAGLNQISDFKVQQSFKGIEFGFVVHAQLHHFADASDQAYGTVSYLRLVNNNNKIYVTVVMG